MSVRSSVAAFSLLFFVNGLGAHEAVDRAHKFEDGGGISGVAVLAESHISVHTWPEKGYAAFDVFMCGNAEPRKALDVFKRAWEIGLVNTTCPAEYGGAEVRSHTLAEVFRLLAAADPNIAQIPQSHFVYLNVLPDCTSGALPTIRLANPPVSGKVVVKTAKVKATNYKACLALEVPAYVAFYKSSPEFLGDDVLTIEVKYAGGRTDLQKITVNVAGTTPQQKI